MRDERRITKCLVGCDLTSRPSPAGDVTLIPRASIIVTCKGRLHHLRRTLPNLLIQHCPFPFEVIVVDYGCPQGTFDWCRSLDVRRLIALKVLDDTEEYDRSRARNCGANIAKSDILAFVDADIFLGATWLEAATRAMLQGDAEFCTVAESFLNGWDRGGTWTVTAQLFHSVRGYDEVLRGWGVEDDDLHRRCAGKASQGKFAADLLTPIKHDHAERVRYHNLKNIEISVQHNQTYLSQRTGLVNPHGYGQGEFEIFRGQGDELPPVTWAKPQRIVRPIRQHASVQRNSFRLPQITR